MIIFMPVLYCCNIVRASQLQLVSHEVGQHVLLSLGILLVVSYRCWEQGKYVYNVEYHLKLNIYSTSFRNGVTFSTMKT